MSIIRRRGTPLFGAPRITKLFVLAIVTVFGGAGMYFLRPGQAAVVNDSGATINLMPETAELRQGEYINVAVNIDTANQPSTSVTANVSYPDASLQLESIEQVCPKPVFQNATQDSTKKGVVTVNCVNALGFNGGQTIAYLVFKAVKDGGSAALVVGTDSAIVRKADNKKLVDGVHTSHMALQPHDLPAQKTKKDLPEFDTKPAPCSLPKPGVPRCHKIIATPKEPHAAVSGYGPKELHTVYQLPCKPGGPVAAVCATPATYGPEMVAIVDAGAYTGGPTQLEKDLTTFSQQFGIPPCTIASGCLKVVNARGSTTDMPADAGWTGETSMDVQAVHAICQTCKITVVLADDEDSLDAAQSFAVTLNPVAISDSWSGGDPFDPGPYNNPGIATVVATGDDGILGNEGNDPVDYPFVIAAGGTTLEVNTDGSLARETVWTGSGAGCSPTEAAGSWQTSLPNWGSVGCGTKRGYNDISALADPDTGMATVENGKKDYGGGTSLSAPLIAGMFGLAGRLPSNVTPSQVLYANNNSNNFRDITSGTNCTNAVKAKCTAVAGFDLPGGLGVPKGLGGFRAAGGVTPNPSPTPTPTPSTSPAVADIDGNGRVDLVDLARLLAAWNSTNAAADLNHNGKVDLTDLAMLLANWNKQV